MVKVDGKRSGRRLRRLLFHALILIGVGGLFSLMVVLIQPFYTFNLWFADQFLDSEAPSTNIVIAGIDDASLKTYGKWSQWSRTLHAEAINNLAKAGASVIGFDVVFADSSPEDQTFGEAIKNANNVVLVVAGTDRMKVSESTLSFRDFLFPEILLKQSCNNLGHVNIIPDPDGKVRRVPLFIKQAEGDTYPSFSLAVLYTLFHKPIPSNISITENKVNLLMRDIPVDSSYLMRINYGVEDNSLINISYADIINNNFDPSLIKNKIVLVGMTATGGLDTWSIPNSAVPVSGVMVHAAAIDTILRTRFLTEIGINTTLLIMLLLALICALVLPRFGTWYWTDVLKGTAFTIGLLVLYLVVSAFLSQRGYILNVLYPTLTLMVLYLGNILYIVVKEQSDKRFVKSLFGRYVSPQISKEIVSLANDGKLKLGGEEKEVTVLFADIRNFTTISERMSPEAIVNMLNSRLPIMIDAIVRNGGLVNKFAGDNLMGVWNAPQSEAEHPVLAVKAACEAQKEVTSLEKADLGKTCVQFGIGINTGKVLAGNVGSLGRAEYTVIGDTVNIASRICGIAQGGQILIGPDTYHHAKSFLEVEALEPQMFKGKSKPIPVYLVKRMIDNP
jgi:adenylate cyclase